MTRTISKCVVCAEDLRQLCAECKEYSFEEECMGVAGQCGHVAHFHCISRWLRTSGRCPADKKVWDFKFWSPNVPLTPIIEEEED